MKLEKIKKQWKYYNEEFDNIDSMDIDVHINMASQVGALVNRVERLEKALRFYATPEFYEPNREEDENRTDVFNFIDLDGGETAREALE